MLLADSGNYSDIDRSIPNTRLWRLLGKVVLR